MPESAYTAPLEDSYTAVKHVLANGHKYGIDLNRVAIIGDSAGGYLAAVVCQKLRSEPAPLPSIKLQLLFNPLLQIANFRTHSHLLNPEHGLLPSWHVEYYVANWLLGNTSSSVLKAMSENRHISPSLRQSLYQKYFKTEYLPKGIRLAPDTEIANPNPNQVDEWLAERLDPLVVDPSISPLLTHDVSGLPPTYLVVPEFDALRDDGLLYAHRLRQAGVKVEVSYLDTSTHGLMSAFFNVTNLQMKQSYTQWEHVYVFLKENL